MDYVAKINYNKNTNQAVVFLSKKKLDLLKHKKAQYITIREKDIF
jgi:hypothetical protein